MNTKPEDAEAGTNTTSEGFSQGQRILNRYLLQRVLGQGGMGIVWQAHDEQLDREVALKFLPPIVVNDRASLHDLKRETRRSLALTHPNIVRTYDFIQDGVIAGISMEYVEGGTLRHRRIDQPGGVFAPEALGCWIGELCAALDYAHGKAAIVHRDLKPANLMIDGRDELKVADFGIARSLVDSVSQMTAQRGISGTLVYMSPQQLCGDAPSPLDDIYALGATIFELLTTKPPFYSGDVAGQVANRPPPTLRERRESFGLPPGNIPANWEETVAACLAKDASLRPKSAGEVAVRLGLATAASTTNIAAANPGTAPVIETATRLAEPATLPAAPPTQTFVTPPPLPRAPIPQRAPTSRTTIFAVIGGLAAILLLLLGGAAWYVGTRVLNQNGGKIDRSAIQTVSGEKPLVGAHGRVVVKTEPAGATVKVGNARTDHTPAVFNDLNPGKYPVEISLEGYDPVVMQAEVKDNQPIDLGTVTLKPSKGVLRIVSTPPGIPYELRSKANPSLAVRGVTSDSTNAVPIGEYQITAAREGWPVQQQIIIVTREGEQTANFEFVPGSVHITSEPDAATVRVGTKEIGKTPLDLPNLTPGEVNYTLVRAGYSNATVTGMVQPGAQLPLHATLEKIAAKKTTVSNSSRQPSTQPKSGNDSSGYDKAGKIMDLINRSGFPHHRPF